MKKQHDGFAMLLVLMICSGLLTLSLATWHEISRIYDILNERKNQSKHHAAALTFFNATVSMLRTNIHFFIKSKIQESLPLYFEIQSHDPNLNKHHYTAMLILEKTSHKNSIQTKLMIFKEKKSIKHMTWLCFLKKINNKEILEISCVE